MFFTACTTLLVSALFGASTQKANQLPEWLIRDTFEIAQENQKVKDEATNRRLREQTLSRKSSTPATLSLQRNLDSLTSPDLSCLYSSCPLDEKH